MFWVLVLHFLKGKTKIMYQILSLVGPHKVITIIRRFFFVPFICHHFLLSLSLSLNIKFFFSYSPHIYFPSEVCVLVLSMYSDIPGVYNNDSDDWLSFCSLGWALWHRSYVQGWVRLGLGETAIKKKISICRHVPYPCA